MPSGSAFFIPDLGGAFCIPDLGGEPIIADREIICFPQVLCFPCFPPFFRVLFVSSKLTPTAAHTTVKIKISYTITSSCTPGRFKITPRFFRETN